MRIGPLLEPSSALSRHPDGKRSYLLPYTPNRQRKPLPSRPLVPAQRVNSDKTSLNFRRMSNYPVIPYRIVASYRYRRPKVDRSTMVKYVTSCGIFVDLGNRPLQNSRNYLETSFKVVSEYSSIEHIRFCYSRPL